MGRYHWGPAGEIRSSRAGVNMVIRCPAWVLGTEVGNLIELFMAQVLLTCESSFQP